MDKDFQARKGKGLSILSFGRDCFICRKSSPPVPCVLSSQVLSGHRVPGRKDFDHPTKPNGFYLPEPVRLEGLSLTDLVETSYLYLTLGIYI